MKLLLLLTPLLVLLLGSSIHRGQATRCIGVETISVAPGGALKDVPDSGCSHASGATSAQVIDATITDLSILGEDYYVWVYNGSWVLVCDSVGSSTPRDCTLSQVVGRTPTLGGSRVTIRCENSVTNCDLKVCMHVRDSLFLLYWVNQQLIVHFSLYERLCT